MANLMYQYIKKLPCFKGNLLIAKTLPKSLLLGRFPFHPIIAKGSVFFCVHSLDLFEYPRKNEIWYVSLIRYN